MFLSFNSFSKLPVAWFVNSYRKRITGEEYNYPGFL